MSSPTERISSDTGDKRGTVQSWMGLSLIAGRGARKAALAVLLPILVIVIWQYAGRGGGSLFGGVLPTPDRVWSAWNIWAFGPAGLGLNPYSGTWMANLLFSAERVGRGFLFAILVGVPAGIAIGWNRISAGALDPTIQLLRPIPITAWLPFSIAVFGIRDIGAIFLISLGAFFPIVLNTAQGARDACCADDGGRALDGVAPGGAAGVAAVHLYRITDRPRHRLDRGDRRRDGGRQIRTWVRAVGCLLRRPYGRGDRRHGVHRPARAAQRYGHPADRTVGAELAPSAIVSVLRLQMGTITFEGVSKTYNGQREVRALEDVSLKVDEGEFVALLGPSGCGKSTLLNVLAGFEQISKGKLLFDGTTIDKPGPDRGVVFQEAALFPWLTVWQNVIFGPQVQGMARSEYEARARQLLDLVGLSAFADALPVQLSGGMRQRVGIARVLVMNPRALLMDEPFGALDAQTRLSMQQLLLDVWQKLNTTVLFVTHDIDEAILLSDRICVMSARPGRIIKTIPIELARPRSIASLTSPEFVAYKAEIMADIRITDHH